MMRGRVMVAILSTAAAAVLILWPAPGFELLPRLSTTDPRAAFAVKRGLAFIQTVARDRKGFEENGFDLVWCFCSIAQTSADPEIRDLARRFGREQALRWRAAHPRVDAGAGTDDLYQLVAGSHAAECLGVRNEAMRKSLTQAVQRMKPEEMFRFDPRNEAPPGDIPKLCSKCGRQNARGSRKCSACGTELEWRDRYAIWCDAIIAAYSAEVYGVRFGASLSDVLQWAPDMRPYPAAGRSEQSLYDHAVYAVTHFVYAMNGYSHYRLRPEWFPQEFKFLRSNIRQAIGTHDPEALGEYIDTLKSFGLTEADAEMGVGIRYLLAHQNADGSWGDPADPDLYNRYHTTWTAIDGLREYRWHGERVAFPETLLRLKR